MLDKRAANSCAIFCVFLFRGGSWRNYERLRDFTLHGLRYCALNAFAEQQSRDPRTGRRTPAIQTHGSRVGKLSRADRSAQLVLGLLSNLFDGTVIVNEF